MRTFTTEFKTAIYDLIIKDKTNLESLKQKIKIHSGLDNRLAAPTAANPILNIELVDKSLSAAEVNSILKENTDLTLALNKSNKNVILKNGATLSSEESLPIKSVSSSQIYSQETPSITSYNNIIKGSEDMVQRVIVEEAVKKRDLNIIHDIAAELCPPQ